MMRSRVFVLCAIFSLVVGCGSSNDGPAPSGTAEGGQGDGSAPAEGGNEASVDGSSDGGVPSADGSTADSGDAMNPASDAAITGVAANAWTWIPVEGAICRDGSPTGIGLNLNPASDKLMIFLQGGGACFNAFTCLTYAHAYGASDFAADAPNLATSGMFNRADPANPVKDWNFVFVPYCTGDVFGGNKRDVAIASLGPQQFVGYADIGLFLQRIVPTFPSVNRVLLTGVSAGGFGAAANYMRTATAFGSIPVYLLDDSGPFMDAPYVAPCLSQLWLDTWGFDKTFLADCGSDCAADAGGSSNYLVDYARHALALYPNVPWGLVESTADGTIRNFFGFAAQNCTSLQQLPADTFDAGLNDLKTKLAGYSNFGSFVFTGTDHTTLENTAALDTRTTGSTKLTDWVSALITAGTVSSVGP